KTLNPHLREYIDYAICEITTNETKAPYGWYNPVPDVYLKWNEARSLNDLSPAWLYLPKIFYWAPHLAAGVTLYCPSCTANGRSNKLSPKGWENDVRRVVDMAENWYIYSRRYI
ncbi:hypothetical protein V1504DRAFT_369916, partial [Lipomyces starkeyi]